MIYFPRFVAGSANSFIELHQRKLTLGAYFDPLPVSDLYFVYSHAGSSWHVFVCGKMAESAIDFFKEQAQEMPKDITIDLEYKYNFDLPEWAYPLVPPPVFASLGISSNTAFTKNGYNFEDSAHNKPDTIIQITGWQPYYYVLNLNPANNHFVMSIEFMR